MKQTKDNTKPKVNEAKEVTPQKEAPKTKEEEYKELAQRIQADFENYKKRIDRDLNDMKEKTRLECVRKLLPLLDSFEQAIIQINKPKLDTSESEVLALKKGFEIIFGQLQATLKAEGVRPMQTIGKKADPYLHDILFQQESEKPHGEILEELQKGYMLESAVLRHAKVKTSAGKLEENPKGDLK